MSSAALFKFALTALLLAWPGARNTPPATDMAVMAYCYSGALNANGFVQEQRSCRIARELSEVVEEHADAGHIPFQGPKAKEATVLALLEIARHESDFREKVEDCRITGDPPSKHAKIDEGLAISMYQLRSNSWYDLFKKAGVFPGTSHPRPRSYLREEVCRSNPLAARLALHALMRLPLSRKKNPSTYPAGIAPMFFTYSGNRGRPSKAGREHIKAFEMMMRQNKLVMVPTNGPMWVEAAP